MRNYLNLLLALMTLSAVPASSSAQGFDFPPGFTTREIVTNGATIHVRSGGSGPAVVLLHGYGETGDMWVALAAELARDHTVIVPDLRGLGLSSKPSGGFDKKTQAEGVDGEIVRANRVYVAPGDFHMLVEAAPGGDKIIKLSKAPAENFCRPSVDPMLRSLAQVYGRRLLCVILTGMGHDGRGGGTRFGAIFGIISGTILSSLESVT